MTLKTTAAAAALLLACASVAHAQTRPAAAAAATPAVAPTPLKSGPALAGVCVFSSERAMGQSSAGKAMVERMKQLAATVQAELKPESDSLNADITAYRGQRAALPAEQQRQRDTALEQRANAFQQKQQLRENELRQTLAKAQQRIGGAMEPIARGVYESRPCSILLNGDGSVMAANPAMDITDAVRAQLDTRLPSITFEREHLDQQAPGASR